MTKNIYRLLLVVSFGLFALPLFSQHSLDKIKGLNELELGQELNELVDELQMNTGNESVYRNYPRLAESVNTNLKKGIKEGIYLEGPKRVINGEV